MSTDLTPAAESKPWISNRTYDAFKWLVQIFLPAFSALYFGLAQIWGLPNAEGVVGTIAIVTIFLGTLLKISNNSYNNSDAKYDGSLVVDTSDDEKDVYSFEVNVPFEELKDKKELTIKVHPTA